MDDCGRRRSHTRWHRSLWLRRGDTGYSRVRVQVSRGRPSTRRGRCQWGSLERRQWGSLQWAMEHWGLGGGYGRPCKAVSGVPAVHVDIVLWWLRWNRRVRRVNVHVVPLSVEERCNGKGQSGACGDRRAVSLIKTCGITPHEGQKGLSLNGVEGTGNGLECGRNCGAAVGVVGDDRFDELAE